MVSPPMTCSPVGSSRKIQFRGVHLRLAAQFPCQAHRFAVAGAEHGHALFPGVDRRGRKDREVDGFIVQHLAPAIGQCQPQHGGLDRDFTTGLITRSGFASNTA